MKLRIYLVLLVGLMCGCNHVHVVPDSLPRGAKVYAERGGYSMRRLIKEHLTERGYVVSVGRASGNKNVAEDVDLDTYIVPNDVQYVVTVKERQEVLRPLWCVFNGFWMWRFNVSIANQKTGEELLSWFGYGCANSSERMLEKLLDTLEK